MKYKQRWGTRLAGRTWLGLLLLGMLQLSQVVAAQEFVWAPDFTPGTSIPEISAEDQNGTLRSFDDLKGEKGLLFMLSRSFDW